MRRAQIARQKVQVFKPKIDDRYSIEQIASHSGMTHVSKPVMTAKELMAQIEDDTQVVGIDEGQFFDAEIVNAVNELRDDGKRVIIAGLDQDYTGKPFEPMPQLFSIAEFITKTHAICVKCGATANYSQRTFESERARRSRRKRQIRSPLPQMFRAAFGRADGYLNFLFLIIVKLSFIGKIGIWQYNKTLLKIVLLPLDFKFQFLSWKGV